MRPETIEKANHLISEIECIKNDIQSIIGRIDYLEKRCSNFVRLDGVTLRTEEFLAFIRTELIYQKSQLKAKEREFSLLKDVKPKAKK